ncbi:MAG: prefoldin subunit beta [Candidatus Lokiarchaeota archaeon]|nr:prefoldin subunit beta [Candidatus Lokiarchaeota archaeon]
MTINLDNLNEEQKKKLLNLNNLQQSFEFITSQRLQVESTFRETELAIEELEKINPEDTVYKSIGGILVKSEKNKLLDEKKSLKVTLEMRLKTLKQKEDRVKVQIETMRKSLQADFQK